MKFNIRNLNLGKKNIIKIILGTVGIGIITGTIVGIGVLTATIVGFVQANKVDYLPGRDANTKDIINPSFSNDPKYLTKDSISNLMNLYRNTDDNPPNNGYLYSKWTLPSTNVKPTKAQLKKFLPIFNLKGWDVEITEWTPSDSLGRITYSIKIKNPTINSEKTITNIRITNLWTSWKQSIKNELFDGRKPKDFVYQILGLDKNDITSIKKPLIDKTKVPSAKGHTYLFAKDRKNRDTFYIRGQKLITKFKVWKTPDSDSETYTSRDMRLGFTNTDKILNKTKLNTLVDSLQIKDISNNGNKVFENKVVKDSIFKNMLPSEFKTKDPIVLKKYRTKMSQYGFWRGKLSLFHWKNIDLWVHYLIRHTTQEIIADDAAGTLTIKFKLKYKRIESKEKLIVYSGFKKS